MPQTQKLMPISLQLRNTQVEPHRYRERKNHRVWVSRKDFDSEAFCFRIIDFKHFPEFVFCPHTVLHSEWDRFVAQNDYCGAIILRAPR